MKVSIVHLSFIFAYFAADGLSNLSHVVFTAMILQEKNAFRRCW